MWRERMSLCCEEWNEAEWECCMAGAETPGVGVGVGKISQSSLTREQ